MSILKIFGSKDNNSVWLRGKINDFKNYKELKNKIIDISQSKSRENVLKESDVFILCFNVDKKKDLYIPDELSEGIWDNKTFSYFKEKLSIRGIDKAVYKLYVQKVKKTKKWKRKENHEFLREALEANWPAIHENLLSEVSLAKLEQSNINYRNLKEKLKKNEEKINNEKHYNIVCNNCFKKDFNGKRFICGECNNYNLCQDCEKIFYSKQIHPREHSLIQINKSLNDEIVDNLSKYNNIIGNKNQEFKNVPEYFQLEVSIINNGENNLKDCYILPVRFGDEYLSCCPKVIEEDIQRNMIVKVILVIRIPHSNKGYFQGYFRMFTPNGLPFGDVLSVNVLNGD